MAMTYETVAHTAHDAITGRAVLVGSQLDPRLWIVVLFKRFILCDDSDDGWLLALPEHCVVADVIHAWELRGAALRARDLRAFRHAYRAYYRKIAEIAGSDYTDPDVEARYAHVAARRAHALTA